MRTTLPVASFAVVVGLAAASASAQTIPLVFVGNPGNGADATGYGSVSYEYLIARTEVTNEQYAAFLNAVAATDTNNLYHPDMALSFGGITRSGSPGAFTYELISGRRGFPVVFVGFWDAARFANWLHNGRPSGVQDATTTEDGAYTLTADGIAQNSVVRSTHWIWAVASENEWYKAAYHQPATQSGDIDNYWLYPTSSNMISSADANYDSVIADLAPVGSYAANFYGAFDMGGNVWEWDEAIVAGPNRVLRGGTWVSPVGFLQATFRNETHQPTVEVNTIGFRVVRALCLADFSSSADPNDLGYGVPDGAADSDDFFYFLDQFIALNLAEADVSGSADPNDPAYGMPDGAIDASDFFYYLDLFVSGCP